MEIQTTIPDTEIRVEISSNKPAVGKTTVAVAVANALKAAFPTTKVIVEDPEGCFLARRENMAQTDSGCALKAPSIRIVDNPRLLQGPRLLGHQIITIEAKPDDAVALLLQAYVKGEMNGEMDWSDVDVALAAAHVERPGYYETALSAARAKETSAGNLEQQRFLSPSEIASAMQDQSEVYKIAVQTQEVMDKTAKEFGLKKIKDND